MASSVNLSALTKYTDQLKSGLITEAVAMGKSLKLASIQTGIKYAEALNYLSSNLVLQAGGCGTNGNISATGSVSLSQRTIQVAPILIRETICVDDLEQYWTGQSMKAGSNNESGPAVFEEVYVAKKVKDIQFSVENLFWKGSSSGTYSSSYTLAQGILSILEETSATASVINGSGTYSGALTTANAINVVEGMIALRPEAIAEENDLTLFMSFANYQTLVRAMRIANNFHFFGDEGKDMTFTYPGTNVKIVATTGLSGLNKMILTPASNLVVGVDMENEYEDFSFYFNPLDQLLYFTCKFKFGSQVIYPQYIVKYNG